MTSPIGSLLTALACAALCGMSPAAASDRIPPAPSTWSVSKNFGKSDEEARQNLSGAACAPTTPPLHACLIVNDQKKFAQTFSIAGTTLEPGKIVRLLDKGDGDDPDGEAAAYDEGHFYVVGSHGRKRKDWTAHNPSSYALFRFPLDGNGQPIFVGDEKVQDLARSTRLGEALKALPPLSAYVDQPLDEGGINIEGLAVRGARIYLGLRGPSRDGHAYIVSVNKAAAFTASAALDARLHPLKLGRHAGIRDLAVVKNGLLILSGPVNDQTDAVPSVFLWTDGDEPTKLGELQLPEATDAKELKAETLLVLQDAADAPLRVLVMFDGPDNGLPTEYVLKR
ncbi:MAG: DUF3616 domain-containing protein [Rhodopseudomonas palustris]|uniref:DUF3616 domain-containing protein n=1 Tax=Rhodopseudomonas palustris TaxID=1076 RepID=A0A933RT13_RHOPL|nr:DUF3616 domain-containing protein [Rhodopseudomonas palustris]